MFGYYKVRATGACAIRSLFRLPAGRAFLALTLMAVALVGAAFPTGAKADSDTPQVQTHTLLPMVSAAPHVDPEQTCTPNYQELMIFEYMQEHPDQGRHDLRCDPILARVARARAQDMAERGYFDHVSPDGFGPNYLVREAGFELPDWYPDSPSSNNLESIGAHFATAADVWEAWVNAEGHRLHVLGTDPFFAEQEEVGVGYYYDAGSQYGAYWVLITAPAEPK